MRRAILAACLLAPSLALADAWTLSGADSKLSFGSIKKESVGEVHHFTGLSGGVAPDGAVTVEIDLASVETWIDIRNERMAEHVFAGLGPARLTATVDLAALEGLAPGEGAVTDVTGALTLGPVSLAVEAPFFVARLGEDRALVVTDEMIFVGTEALGVDAGVETLREIAELPSITRAVPVTMRLVFDRGAAVAAAAPAAAAVETAAAAGGDPKNGARVFRKCKACHAAGEARNRVGPHLVGVIGRKAGSVDGFRYSEAMAALDEVWTPEALAAFLAAPKGYLKGTKMQFAGLKKPDEIEDVIAYLASWN